ncbi:MAG: hypothetical protein KC457_31950, partial [Myxococcales bacterium]|nr:hypothetical protein [Myxococcales bacterium]
MAAFLSEHGKQALRGAIEAVEARSCAEVVIAVRDHSGSYLHADLITGGLAAVASVAALLYAPVDFALPWFLIDPLVVGVLVGVLASRLPGLRRLLTPASARAARVQVGAQAAFFARGVRRTRQRVGILVYISL